MRLLLNKNLSTVRPNNIKYASGRLIKKPYIHFNLNNICETKLNGIYNKATNINNPEMVNLEQINYNNINNSLQKFKLSYNNLKIDTYIENNDPPKRLRKFARYYATINTKYSDIEYDDNTIYNQTVDDNRNNTRVFSPIDKEFIYSNFILNLLNYSINNIKYFVPDIKKIQLDVHQVRNIIYPNSYSTNSPEGVHRDGCDFIISAFVVNKINIKGGTSIIKNYDKTDHKYIILNNGEGIFQEDRELWHYITPFECDNHHYLGYRDIIGIDITILDTIN